MGGCDFQRSQRLLIEVTRDLKAAVDLKTCNGCRCFAVVFPADVPVEEAVRFEPFLNRSELGISVKTSERAQEKQWK